MKKLFLNYSFVILSLVGLGFLSSCGEDDVTPTLKVVLSEEEGYIFEDATLAPGASFKIKWTATKGGSNMETFVVKEGNVPVLTEALSGGEKDKYTDEIQLSASNVEGEYVYTFTVTDKDGASASETVKITVAKVNSYTTVLLGNQLNANDPSFYATSSNTRYKVADAKSNSDKVDFGYGNGSAAGNEFFIGAPSDESIQAVFPSVKEWTTKNNTKFVTTDLTAAQFDAIATPDVLLKAVEEGKAPNAASRVRGVEIEEGKVVGFTTAAGKKGLIKVISRTGSSSAAGSITIAVKVQK